MATFKDTVEQLYGFAVLHAAIFLFGFGLMIAPQSSYGPQPACSADFSYYQVIGFIDFFLSLGIVASAFLAASVRCEVTAANGMAGVAPVLRARLRVQLLAALLFSAATTAGALTVTTFILQVKTSVLPCWSAAQRAFVFASLALVASICAYVYTAMVRAAIYAE